MINQRKAGATLHYLQMALNILISLVYTPVMLRTLGQGEYGIYQLASSIISYLSLLSLGFSASYIRFYTQRKRKGDEEGVKKLNGMYMTVFLVIAAIAFGAGLILSFNVGSLFSGEGYTANDMHIAKIVMIFLAFNLALSFPSSVFTSYISSQEKFVFQKLINMGKTVLSPMLTLPVLLLGYGSIGMVIVTSCVTLLIDVINMLYCLLKLKMRFNFRTFEWRVLKDVAIFSGFIAINQVIDQINWNVGQIILAKRIGKEAVAIYAVASTLNTMYISFSSAISSVFVPQVHRIVVDDKNSNSRLNEVFVRVGRVQFALMALTVSGLVIFGKYFIFRWAGADYGDAYYLALLLICPCTIALVQNVGIEIQRAKNLHKFRSFAYLIMAIVNIGISILLCHYIGILGVAVGTTISLVLCNGIIMNVYYHKKVGLNILSFWKNILRMCLGLIIPIAFGVVIILFIDYDGLIDFIFWILLYACIYALSMWYLGFNSYEKNLFIRPVKAIIAKLKALLKKIKTNTNAYQKGLLSEDTGANKFGAIALSVAIIGYLFLLYMLPDYIKYWTVVFGVSLVAYLAFQLLYNKQAINFSYQTFLWILYIFLCFSSALISRGGKRNVLEFCITLSLGVLISLCRINEKQQNVIIKRMFFFLAFVLVGCFFQRFIPELAKAFAGVRLDSDKFRIYLDLRSLTLGFSFQTGVTGFYLALLCGMLLCYGFTQFSKNKLSRKLENRTTKIWEIFVSVMYVLALVSSLVFLFLTAKRGFIVFVIIIGVILACLFFRQHLKKVLLICAGVIVALVAVCLVTDFGKQLIQRTLDSMFTGRTELYAEMLKMFKSSPIWGCGAASCLSIKGKTNGHNIFLQILAETGLVGFVLIVPIFVYDIVASIKILNVRLKNKQNVLSTSFCLFVQLLFVLWGITGNPLYDIYPVIVYALASSIIRNQIKDYKNGFRNYTDKNNNYIKL